MKGPKKYKKQNKRKYDFPIEKSVEHAKLEYCEERMGLDLEDKLEELVRKQQKLQAVKTLAENTSYGIMDSKDAIERYIETGNWDHISWHSIEVKYTLMDSVFARIHSETPFEWTKNHTKQEHRTKLMLNRINNNTQPPYLILSEALSLAKMYGVALLEKHKDEVWDYIKSNYRLTYTKK